MRPAAPGPGPSALANLAPCLLAAAVALTAACGGAPDRSVAGGFLAPPEGHPGDERPPAARRLLAYDPAEDAWSEEGRVPVGTHHAGLLGIDGLLYLVGG